jgi:hypothetical protein
MINEFNELAKLQKQTGQVIKGKMIENLRANKSVVSGNLIRSIGVTSPEEPNDRGNLETVLEIKAWYAELVDKGIDNRGPGKQPPVRPIQEWLKRKSISVPAGVTIEQYSFAIAKKISKKGQRKKAYPFIQPAIKFGEEFFERRVNEAIGIDAEIDVNIILDSSPYLKKVR